MAAHNSSNVTRRRDNRRYCCLIIPNLFSDFRYLLILIILIQCVLYSQKLIPGQDRDGKRKTIKIQTDYINRYKLLPLKKLNMKMAKTKYVRYNGIYKVKNFFQNVYQDVKYTKAKWNASNILSGSRIFSK